MRHRGLLIAFAIFIWSEIAYTQTAPNTYMAYSATDLKTPPAAPALGAANSMINDPTFGTAILRVTDTNTNGGQSFISTDSGFHRSWNSNSTRIKLTGPRGDGWWLEFNAAAFKVGDGTANPRPHAIPSQYAQTWEWSKTNPDIIYVLHGSQIATYNVVTGATTDLGGPSTGEMVAYWPAVIGDDNWVCSAAGSGIQQTWSKLFCLQPANPSTTKFIDLGAYTINGTGQGDPNWPTPASGTIGIHGLAGGTGDRWLSVTFANQSWGGNGEAVFNLVNDSWSLMKGPPTGDIYWGGHTSTGNGRYINGAGNQGGQDSRGVLVRNPNNLMDSNQYQFVGQPAAPYNGWCDAEHTSWLNSASNANAPVIQSRYGGASGCNYPWRGEILAIATDQSNTVWRFAHNHNLGGPCYYGQSFAQVSNDGLWILFSSPWDGQLGADTAFGCTSRIDTFILKLVSGDTPPPLPVLAWTQQPTATVTGAAITPALAGTLTPAAAHSLAVAVESGNCTLGGTLTASANGTTGAWSFPGVTVSSSSLPANCVLRITDTTNTSVQPLISNSFNVNAQPIDTVTLSVNSGPCQLTGTTTIPAPLNLTFSFPGVTVTSPTLPATCTLKIHSSNPSVADEISAPFTITANAPAIPVLAFTQQPTTTVTGAMIAPAISGTLTPGSVRSLSVSSPQANCGLSGNLTVTSSSAGNWSFPGLIVIAVGLPATCTLIIHDNSLTNAALDKPSAPFTVNANVNAMYTLTWISQPTTTATGAAVIPMMALKVEPLPPIGQPGIPVTLTATGGCSFMGTLTQTSEPFVSQSPGVVAFPGLVANALGMGCVITASAPGATSVMSTPFSITNPLPPMPVLTYFPVPRVKP